MRTVDRGRVEAICYGESAAFVRRLPYDADRITKYAEDAEWVRQSDPALWSDEATLARGLDDLRRYGAPEWLIRRYERASPRGSA